MRKWLPIAHLQVGLSTLVGQQLILMGRAGRRAAGHGPDLGSSLGTAIIGAALLAALATGFSERITANPTSRRPRGRRSPPKPSRDRGHGQHHGPGGGGHLMGSTGRIIPFG